MVFPLIPYFVAITLVSLCGQITGAIVAYRIGRHLRRSPFAALFTGAFGLQSVNTLKNLPLLVDGTFDDLFEAFSQPIGLAQALIGPVIVWLMVAALIVLYRDLRRPNE